MILILILSIAANVYMYQDKNCVKHTDTIVEIGVCDFSGHCAVKTASGRIEGKVKPFVGEDASYYICD